MEIGDGDNYDGDDDDEDNDDSEDQFCEFWLPLAGKSEQNLSPRFPPTINERDSFLRLFSFFNLSFELLNGHSISSSKYSLRDSRYFHFTALPRGEKCEDNQFIINKILS